MARKSRAKPAALVSTSAKTGKEIHFISNLRSLGWRIYASGGTYAWLRQYGVPCTNVSSIVGEPILGHRVVTLSRELYAAILSRDTEEDAAELRRIGVGRIDLVYVGLYDLAAALADPEQQYKDVREKIDIGGPTLLRAAAKGGRLVAASEDALERVVRLLSTPPDPNPFRGGRFENGFMHQLYAEAEQAAQAHSKLAEQFYQQVADGAWSRWGR